MTNEKNEKKKEDTAAVVKSIGKGAVSTVVLQGKLLRKIWANTLGAIWFRFWHATLVGKILTLVGLAGCITVTVLAFRTSIQVSVDHREFILVTSSLANVRESVSQKSEIVSKVKRGDELTRKGEAEDYWFVQGEGWEKPGWLHKNTARREEKVLLDVRYEMKGFGWLFLASFVIFYIGMCLRRGT